MPIINCQQSFFHDLGDHTPQSARMFDLFAGLQEFKVFQKNLISFVIWELIYWIWIFLILGLFDNKLIVFDLFLDFEFRFFISLILFLSFTLDLIRGWHIISISVFVWIDEFFLGHLDLLRSLLCSLIVPTLSILFFFIFVIVICIYRKLEFILVGSPILLRRVIFTLFPWRAVFTCWL